MNYNHQEVFRLVYEENGKPVGTYNKQNVYKEIGHARGQATKHNNSWRHEKVVIQRGLIQWIEDPV